MNLFGKKDKETNTTLNLSKEEKLQTLDLRKNMVLNLTKTSEELNNLTSRVALVLDYSGSMSRLYNNGTVQSVVERIFPLAVNFDDNQELDIWIFSNGFHRLSGVTKENFYGYVKEEIMNSRYRMGGTEYAPVMNDVYNKYIKEEPVNNMPSYVIFITDGDNSDKRQTTQEITTVSKYPIFWQFVGIGNSSMEFLEKLDDMDGRYIDNANFFRIKDIDTINDEDLYKKLLNEYPSWLKEAKNKNIY